MKGVKEAAGGSDGSGLTKESALIASLKAKIKALEARVAITDDLEA